MDSQSLVWIITAATILLILIRPKQLPEAIWACSGALLLVAFRLIAPHDALAAVGKGTDVYLFLTGMMILAELARREGFFDWVAVIAVTQAKASPARLFLIIYAVGTVVTTFLSNDATAVVLTPAVHRRFEESQRQALAVSLYLRVYRERRQLCAAHFESGEPGHLRLENAAPDGLAREFALPSLASIVLTFLVLRFAFREDLQGELAGDVEKTELSPAGRRAAYGIIGSGVALILASAFDLDLGLPTFLAALAAAVIVTLEDREAPQHVVKDISWSVLPLVAGLFVIVEAVNKHGALSLTQQALQLAAHAGRAVGAIGSAFSIALLSNVANNLPVGLIAGSALKAGGQVPPAIRNALLIGVDLGPNLVDHRFARDDPVAGGAPPRRRRRRLLEVSSLWRAGHAARADRGGSRVAANSITDRHSPRRSRQTRASSHTTTAAECPAYPLPSIYFPPRCRNARSSIAFSAAATFAFHPSLSGIWSVHGPCRRTSAVRFSCTSISSIMPLRASTAARSIVFSSSRTLPGQCTRTAGSAPSGVIDTLRPPR